jgi:acetyl esterase/lipase
MKSKPMVETRLSLLIAVLVLLSIPSSAETKTEATKWPLPPVPPGVAVYPDLPYVSNGSPSQKLDLYVPNEGQKMPLIIYVHGGAFYMGDKRKWIRYDLGYLRQGYAMASINYRLSDEAPFPAQIEDCKAAVRWLRAHAPEYRLDPNHFAVWERPPAAT